MSGGSQQAKLAQALTGFDDPEQEELGQALKSGPGRDYLEALPLLQAEFSTRAFLYAIRKGFAPIGAQIERHFGLELCVLAFGSLGRYEFVAEYSDLDPLIIVKMRNAAPFPGRQVIRAAILDQFLKLNPWLQLDDRDAVLNGAWDSINNADLKYPVLEIGELDQNSPDKLTRQRCWQLLLEAVPLYGPNLFEEARENVVPKLRAPDGLNLGQIFHDVPGFFAGFDDPQFLYKDAFKYWKGRILREFYMFSNIMNIFLGSFLDAAQNPLKTRHLSGSSAFKIMRLTRFASQLEQQTLGNAHLSKEYGDFISDSLSRHGIGPRPMSRFGASGTYQTDSGRLLHALNASILSRFAVCWRSIYDENTRSILGRISKSVNFDARFPAALQDPGEQYVVGQLMSQRKNYLTYMSAIADVINQAFVAGSLWPPPRVGIYNASSVLTRFII